MMSYRTNEVALRETVDIISVSFLGVMHSAAPQVSSSLRCAYKQPIKMNIKSNRTQIWNLNLVWCHNVVPNERGRGAHNRPDHIRVVFRHHPLGGATSFVITWVYIQTADQNEYKMERKFEI